ncbi:Gfo/Idh/MocA family protein [Pontibacillus marinus]|uniref:Oxidoreductase n=1 Tax=Pontibacillus marinus BH030004 = DSM 16465 TaxID=1385511 RepID=A0A0A5G0H8_9BACI|nr:Gfo/Idh/MocA family oxidoreductase [Pontibacillus marinus]KGX84560.1 oxidoreductase [Pontibacillus marinus BH030004 = DSM 16465]
MSEIIRFGVIGCGLMGREFASVVSRWCHLEDVHFKPEIVGVCDTNAEALGWFDHHLPKLKVKTTNYKELLESEEIDAIYCAVPHFLHKDIYIDIIKAGKHLLGEKPFGMNSEDNAEIMKVIRMHPEVIVRCSSEFPFFPGAYQIIKWVNENRFGKIIDVEAGFYHSSDLNPNKAINWKRKIETNGEYGCMGDLGLHVVHLPFRFGWKPNSVRALLSNIVTERPDKRGDLVPCETWDNAILACDVKAEGQKFPMILSMKRIAPGHANTWFIKVRGTVFSAEFSTKNPKQVSYLSYSQGGDQAWQIVDVPYKSAYQTITGGIFEFGFSDSILQMWAAFCDEIIHKDDMKQPLYCATPSEAELSHKLFTAALESNKTSNNILLDTKEVVH